MLNLASMPRHDVAHTSKWSSTAGMTENINWEQTLISIGLDRDKAAYALLFKHFAPRLKAFGIKLFGNEQQALEMVQDTMLNVWQKASLFDATKGAASTWIFTIARNIRFDMLRKKQRRKEDISSDDLWFDGEYPDIELEQSDYHWDITLLLDKLAPHFALLPLAQSEIITKIYLEEKTHQEVSDELSIPLGTVKSRLRLALDRLKEAFDGSHN